MDHAAMMIGAVAAGIYWTSATSEVEYIVKRTHCAVLLAENETQWAKVARPRAFVPRLQRVVMMRDAKAADTWQATWEDFMALGVPVHQAEVDRQMAALQPEDLGTLIYTSGTTGAPKAVTLAHGNPVWTAVTLSAAFGSRSADLMICYLPLANVGEQLAAIHNHVNAGYALYFAQSMESLGEHLKEVRPTVFFGVPRVWEKMHAGIAAKLALATGFKVVLVRWALGVGHRWHASQLDGKIVGPWLQWQKTMASHLIHEKGQKALGLDQARLMISAAAPISTENLRFFTGLDMLIREVYGQSEDCGLTSISLDGSTRIGSVGKPMAGTEIRVAEDGEILVRGPHVFQGYKGRPEETALALVTGWLHTGDLGHFDKDGFLYISGRKKDLLITSGGKNISPTNIEAELQRGLDTLDQTQARVAWIRKFTVIAEPLSIDSGALTDTMKIKRKVVLERSRDVIEKMYAV